MGIDLAAYVVQEGPVFRLSGDKNDRDRVSVDTTLAYRNLVQNADYSNLADPSVHLSYEDHFARIVVPVRQQFNDLATAYLEEENPRMALTVMGQALEKLYGPHLPASYTNIEAAEILLGLGENELADKLSLAAFNYYNSIVMEDSNGASRNLERYLVRRAAELLLKTGHRKYIEQLPASRG
jgi:hypothetical protein